jgi:hypothetical protein
MSYYVAFCRFLPLQHPKKFILKIHKIGLVYNLWANIIRLMSAKGGLMGTKKVGTLTSRQKRAVFIIPE